MIIEYSRTTRARYHQEKNQLFAVVAQCTIFFIVNAIIYPLHMIIHGRVRVTPKIGITPKIDIDI